MLSTRIRCLTGELRQPIYIFCCCCSRCLHNFPIRLETCREAGFPWLYQDLHQQRVPLASNEQEKVAILDSTTIFPKCSYFSLFYKSRSSSNNQSTGGPRGEGKTAQPQRVYISLYTDAIEYSLFAFPARQRTQ